MIIIVWYDASLNQDMAEIKEKQLLYNIEV